MKDTPLLMIQDMVSKTLEDIKTKTRRVVKFPWASKLGQWESSAVGGEGTFIIGPGGEKLATQEQSCMWHTRTGKVICCPYGKPGDRLWIKETHYRYGKWIKNGLSKTGRQRWKFKALSNEVRYFDNPPVNGTIKGHGKGWHKRPSIFMPRWATRLWLEITDIRVERLQDITHADAKAEGVTRGKYYPGAHREPETYRETFTGLWDSINAERDGGAYAWNKNPWVWVITFRRLS